jgi:hypothetical protein
VANKSAALTSTAASDFPVRSTPLSAKRSMHFSVDTTSRVRPLAGSVAREGWGSRVGVAPGAQHLHLSDQACVLASANQILSPSRKAPRTQLLAPRLSVSHVLIGSHSERSTRRDLSIIYKTPVGQNMPQRVLHSPRLRAIQTQHPNPKAVSFLSTPLFTKY